MAEKLLNISWNLTGCITSACVAPIGLCRYLSLFPARSTQGLTRAVESGKHG